MRKLFVSFVLVGFFIYTNPVWAEMTSTNFKIQWDSVSQGGSETSTSTNYGVRDTLGNVGVGNSTSTNYQVDGGYRAGILDQVITFSTLIMDSGSGVTASARTGTTVSLSSTSGFSTGGYIALVQDVGADQVVAIGKITSISSGVSVTVDAWTDNGTTPTIDGTSDFVYSMNGTTVAFGSLNSGAVATSVLGYEVTAAVQNGYSVQILSDGSLTSGSHNITNVSDGAVSLGIEEYGARSSDTSLANATFDTQDAPLTTAFQEIATEASAKFQDRHFLILKAAASTSTPSGTYAQTLTLIASGNF